MWSESKITSVISWRSVVTIRTTFSFSNVWYVKCVCCSSSDADTTSAHSCFQASSFKSLLSWSSKHVSFLYCSQPVWISSCKVITSSNTMAFYERCGSEVFKTRARRYKGLTTSFCTCICVLKNLNKNLVLTHSYKFVILKFLLLYF